MNDRRRAVVEVYLSGGYTMREIGDAFDVHYATVRVVRTAER